jgi:hypothetical protein
VSWLFIIADANASGYTMYPMRHPAYP